jgi:phosphoglycerate dehydrogenase-like enzyme
MALKIFIVTRNSTLDADELCKLLPSNVEIMTGDEVPEDADFEILVHGFPQRAQLEASPKLRALIVPFAGAPKETIDLLCEFPQVSLHSVHFNVAATAELAIGLMLAVAKLVIPLDRELRGNDWRSRYGKTPVIILEGRRVTILGYGRIGQRIGDACRALGMSVCGIRRHAERGVEQDDMRAVPIFPPSALNELLPDSDVLIVALPLTSETQGLIGKKELDLLPPEAILVNVGRGPIVDEEALFTCLQERQFLGAGIDVWYNYPKGSEDRLSTPPSRFPFNTLDNVVMSPHRGGFLSAAEANRAVELATMLRAAAEGRAIPGEVDKELGY